MFSHGIFLSWVRRAGIWLFWPALAVIAWGELTPHPPTLPGPWVWDKAQHFTAYFGLSLLAAPGWELRRSAVWLFAAVIGIGGALEIAQTMVGRDGAWGDFLANSLGALAGLAAAMACLAIPRALVEQPRRD